MDIVADQIITAMKLSDHRERVRLGDYVSAEYVTGISGRVDRLRGIVISVGEWRGEITTSVVGIDRDGGVSSTSQNTMPVQGIASRDSEMARHEWRRIYQATTSKHLRAKMENVWLEMGN